MARPTPTRWILSTLFFAALAVAPTATPATAQTGVIQGRVDLEAPPARRRSANRYPGAAAATQAIQTLPAVVYLVGRTGGDLASSAEMTQHDTTFIPSVVFIPAGGSVAFPNNDEFQHNVYSYSSARTFDLGRQNPGSSASVTFPEVGIVEVFCEVHDFMRGAIVVTESPFNAIVGADGSFRIPGVPAGDYTVAFWHPEHDPQERAVHVPAGGTATVQVQMRR